MTQRNQTYSVLTPILTKRHHENWRMVYVLVCAAPAWMVGSLIGVALVPKPSMPIPSYSQAEVFDIIKGTRSRYEYKGLPVLALSAEDKEEFTRIYNEAMNK